MRWHIDLHNHIVQNFCFLTKQEIVNIQILPQGLF